MKLNKLITYFVGISLSLCLFAGTSYATWAACTPEQVGPYGSYVRIKVIKCNVNPAGTKDGWMTLSTTGTDRMLATVLTAMSLGKPIGIQFDNTKDREGFNYATSVILNTNP